MKILYCCQHPASLLKAICHKLYFYENDQAIIFIEGNKCNDKFNISSISYNEANVIFNNENEDELLSKLDNYITNFTNEHCIELHSFDQIYCIWDVNNIWALYFSIKHIKYNLIEFADNQINYYNSEQFKIDRLNTQLKRYHFDNLSVKHRIFSEKNDYVLTVQFNSTKSRIPVDFTLDKKVRTCTDDYHNEILDKFNMKIRDLFNIADFKNEHSIVLLTNSFGYTKKYLKDGDLHHFFNWMDENMAPSNEDISKILSYFYLSTIDYLFKNTDFCVKFHPASGSVRRYFNGINCLDTEIPFEIISRDFDQCYCFLHTNALNNCQGKSIELGTDFRFFFYDIAFFHCIATFLNDFVKNLKFKFQFLLNGFKFNCEVVNRFIELSFKSSNILHFDNFSTADNHDDRYIFLPSCYVFNSLNSFLVDTIQLMHPDSIIFLKSKYENINLPLENVHFFNFQIVCSSKFIKLNNNIQYFSVVYKNVCHSNSILKIIREFSYLSLPNSQTEVQINLVNSETVFFNLLNNYIFLNDLFSNNTLSVKNTIYHQIDNKFAYLDSFYSKINLLRKDKNENIICLVDDDDNLTKVDSVDGCVFLFRGNGNVIILNKSNQFINCRFEASSGCYYRIRKSRSKISLNICNWTNPNVKFEIDENFCCSSTCKITLPNGNSYIGKECMFSYGIEIRATDGHTIFDESARIVRNREYLYIGNHVWGGCHCRILKCSYIQDNSIIGMNAVVKGNYLINGSVLAGNPAKLVRSHAQWSRLQNDFYLKKGFEIR